MAARQGARDRRVAAIAAGIALLAAAAAPASSEARGPKGFFGVSPAVIISVEELETMRRAGIDTLRFPIFWPIIQSEPRDGRPMAAALSFDRYDGVFLEAAKKGIRLLPYVYGTPDFLTARFTDPPLGTPELRREWRLLLRALQDRYGAGGDLWRAHPGVTAKPVTAWQIWNEPSSASYWQPVKSSPEQYAKLLAISDRVLGGGGGTRSADRRARRGDGPKVIAAGLFGSPTHGLDMPTFLERFYKVKGIRSHFDALALHPYAPGFDGMKLQLQLGRAIMKAAGDARTALWVTEVGWPTGGSRENPFYKTKQQQANLLRRTFNFILGKRKEWRIQQVIWYTWRDNEVNPECDLCRFAGLFDADLKPKPAWREFVRFSGGRP